MQLPVPDNQQDSVDKAVFLKAHVVSIAEVANYLRDIEGPKDKAGQEMRHEKQQAMNYCNQFAQTKDPEVNNAIRRAITKYRVSAYALGLIMNLAPESVEEVKTLIPSLDPTVDGSPFASDDDIQAMLDELQTFRQVEFG